jgi:hypothetical protein
LQKQRRITKQLNEEYLVTFIYSEVNEINKANPIATSNKIKGADQKKTVLFQNMYSKHLNSIINDKISSANKSFHK